LSSEATALQEYSNLDLLPNLGRQQTSGYHGLGGDGASLAPAVVAQRCNSPEICRKHYAALMPQEMHDEVEP
jgi:hypothetical protein